MVSELTRHAVAPERDATGQVRPQRVPHGAHSDDKCQRAGLLLLHGQQAPVRKAVRLRCIGVQQGLAPRAGSRTAGKVWHQPTDG